MNFKLTREFVHELQEIIERHDDAAAKFILKDLHAADIAEIYDELSIDEAKYLYLLLDGEKAADVLAELAEDDRERFLEALPSEIIARQFIDYMDSDDAADVLGDLSEDKQEEVLAHIEDMEQAGDIVDLLNYDEDTAGGLMAKEYIAVNENWTIEYCMSEIKRQAEELDEVYYIYVTNDDGVLQGILPLKKLLITNSKTLIRDIALKNILSAKADTDSEEVARMMHKYDLVALPVVDSIGRLLGRITIDDVVEVIREEADKDYQMISGLSEDVDSTDSVLLITRARLPWLFIGLIGGVFAAQIIGIFEHDLATNAILATFIPLIAAMGGNVGVQSSAIVVQGIANNTIGLESTFQKIIKEVSVAALNGFVLALSLFIYNFFFSESFILTIVVSISLFIVIVFASTFGTFVPLALNRFKVDPAVATGPFITTVNDIMGLFIYLMTARVMFDL